MASQTSEKSILQKYITNGKVDYQRMRDDHWLHENIEFVENADLEEMNYDEQFAFWLNAYNLITLKAVYHQLKNENNWQGNLSLFSKFKFFYLTKHKIACRKISLYNLENKILRKKFKDPRIHFAINCASVSCPYLPGQLFVADTLNDNLDELTFDFINNQNSVISDGDEIHINRIFKWYKKDFKSNGGVLSFIKKYWKGEPFSDDVKIKYLDYNWHINSF